MLSNWFRRSVREQSLSKRGSSRAVRNRVRFNLEQLEGRLAPAFFTWNGANSEFCYL
jgi:hypothetical protein